MGNFLSMGVWLRFKELIVGNVLFPDKVSIEQGKDSKNEKKLKEYLHDTIEYLKDPERDYENDDYTIKETMSDLAFFKLVNCGFEITKEGLQPKPQQESFQQQTPKRPERRKF